MYFQLIVFVVMVLEESTTDSVESESCVTPNGETGRCVAFSDCPIISEAVDAGDDDAYQFSKNSKCGFGPHMVCGGSSRYTTSSMLPHVEEHVELQFRLSDETVCGLLASSNKIKGGTIAEPEEFPWLVALECYNRYTEENAGIRCAGSLVTKEYVLTAAHCIANIEFEVIRAWLGATNISSDHNCLSLGGKLECANSIQKVNITKQIVHPFYNSLQRRNDIGLLQLNSPITFNKYIRPICLPNARSPSPKSETYLSVTGWGITENHKQSDIKLKVEVPVQDNSICNKFIDVDEKLIDSEQLCVGGERGKDSCEGDSGGPLMKSFINRYGAVQWYQVGLVSYGLGCGVDGRPGIYTKVSRYVKWLSSLMYDDGEVDNNLDNGDPCKLPNGTIAKCVPLDTCPAIYHRTASRNTTVRRNVLNYLCGVDNQVLVCCKSPGSVIATNFETGALPDRTFCGVLKEELAFNMNDTTQSTQFPWLVGIEYKDVYTNKTRIWCTGSLISSRYVLTSAYCLHNILNIVTPIPVNVWLGNWQNISDGDCKDVNSTNCTNQTMKVPAKEAVPHPLFSHEYLPYIVGLILLENAVKFTGLNEIILINKINQEEIVDNIVPICLPFPNLSSPEPGTHMVLYAMQFREEKIIASALSSQECGQRIGDLSATTNLNKYKKNRFCRSSITNFSCAGYIEGFVMRAHNNKPSGTLQWYQEGILPPLHECVSKINYDSISFYMDWIIHVISED